MNLLETLAAECSMDYISQLKFSDKWKSVVQKMVLNNDTDNFTLSQWQDAVQYLSVNKYQNKFNSTLDAANFLINMQ